MECCYHGSAKTEFIDHLRVKIVGFVAHSLTVMDVRKQPQTKASESAESYGRTVRTEPCTFWKVLISELFSDS